MAAFTEQVPGHLQEVLATLQELQRRLQEDMTTGLAASPGAGVNPKHVGMGVKLASASAQLGREVRAWLKKQRELSQSASLEEQCQAVVQFIRSLEPTTQQSVLEAIHE